MQDQTQADGFVHNRTRSLRGECGAAATYPLVVTPYYAGLADLADPADPIARQYQPSEEEVGQLSRDPDPFGEAEHMPVPGVIHRYRNRVVVLATDACAVRCRHCTRRNLLGRKDTVACLPDVVGFLRAHPDVREVIISGGDPLMLADHELAAMLAGVSGVATVEVLRIHSRIPVVQPMRITDALCRTLGAYRPLWLNTQFNHPRELTPEALAACERLLRQGIPVSNQCVLLRGVNDSVEVLEALFNGLQRAMIRPYYAFLCDPVQGTAHFSTSLKEARALERELRQRLGGLAMPCFVMDVAGAPCKHPLSVSFREMPAGVL